MLIDTHAHVNFKAFAQDSDEVIKRCLENQVWLINVGSQYATSKKAVEIAEKYPQGVYAAIGLHPIHALDSFKTADYRQFLSSKKVVAIGEIGLDYKSEYLSFKEEQKKVFLEQMKLAQEVNLPIIFHCRQAHAELLEFLKSKIKNQKSKLKGVIHCFTGSWSVAEEYLKMGLFLGFNGIIFKLNLDEVIKKTPLERILLETDCPYLTPPPMEGRNEPIYVKYIAEKIAQIKNLSYEEIIKVTTANARFLFNL